MQTSKYVNIFREAREHPEAKKFYEASVARIKLAEYLYKERTSQSLSMAELAKKSHTTPAVISRIENAQVSAGIDIIFRIFKALGKKNIKLNLEDDFSSPSLEDYKPCKSSEPSTIRGIEKSLNGKIECESSSTKSTNKVYTNIFSNS